MFPMFQTQHNNNYIKRILRQNVKMFGEMKTCLTQSYGINCFATVSNKCTYIIKRKLCATITTAFPDYVCTIGIEST